MTEAVFGWAFLVARGRERGYRTILAPGFLTERRLHGLLSDSANGRQMDSSSPPREVEVERPEIGRLTLVYRTEHVTEAELEGGRNAGLATDEHGRPLEILYGIVCRGRLSGHVVDDDLGAARGEALASYRRFLAEENDFGVDSSEAFALRGVTAVADATPPPRPPEPGRPERRAPRRRGAAAAAVVALVALPLAFTLTGGSSEPHVVDVRASVLPSAGAIDCSRPTSFALEGVIETDAKADVVYHWEAPGWRGPSRQLAFDEAGTRRLPSERHDASIPAGGYVLVVEQPEPGRAEAAHTLRCVEVLSG